MLLQTIDCTKYQSKRYTIVLLVIDDRQRMEVKEQCCDTENHCSFQYVVLFAVVWYNML